MAILNTFRGAMTGSKNKIRAVDVAYLDFCKTFNVVSLDIFEAKPRKYGLQLWTTTWLNKNGGLSASRVVLIQSLTGGQL